MPFLVCQGLIGAPYARAQDADANLRGFSKPADLTINLVIGALTAGAGAALSNHPIRPALINGLVGGGAIYLGKLVVAQNSAQTLLAGRQLSAVGSSIVENAAGGQRIFERLAFPWGPFRLYVQPKGARMAVVKLDLATTIVAIDASRKPYLHLDGKKSVYSGVFVFREDETGPSNFSGGSHLAGVVTFRPGQELPTSVRRTIGHEMVHVSQYDFSFIALAEPLEALSLPVLPGGNWVHRFVDIGLNVPAWSLLNSIIPYAKRPWEREAKTLERGL